MRLSTVLIRCSALVQFVAAKDAYLYTFNNDRDTPSTTPEVVSGHVALSIAARRQGHTNFLSLKGTDDAALSQIAEHGGYQQRIFSESTNTAPPRVLVRIQADKPEARDTLPNYPTLKIQEPTRDLLTTDFQGSDAINYNFGSHSKDMVGLVCRVNQKAPISADMKKYLSSNKTPITDVLAFTRACYSNSVDLVSASIDIDYTTSKIAQSTINAQVDSLLAILHSAISTLSIQPTLLLLPPAFQLAASTIQVSKRQESEEELLDLVTLPFSTPDVDSPTITYKSNTTLPRRFPSCFTSLESCNNITNSCSGHGSCKASGSNKNCFQCKCGRTTIRTNEDGTKKTDLWAGGACQKKDISMEFVLFATFGVTMAALIMGVIGMMYSMGSQELPSVLGAGVAGPSARK